MFQNSHVAHGGGASSGASAKFDDDSAFGDGIETFEPQVQKTKKSWQEREGFWEKLVAESERADALMCASSVRSTETCAPEEGDVPGEDGSAFESCLDCEAGGVDETFEPEESFEKRYERLLGVVNNKPSHREILLRVLSFCAQEREFGVVEDVIQTYPEYPMSGQNPYRLIKYLIDGGGLDYLEIDFEGNVITLERKAGLSEDEIDDLTDCFHVKTTEVGAKLAEDYSPKRRLSDLFSLFGDRKPFYTELLDFCKEPRSYKDIEALFAGRDLSGVRTLHPESGLAIKPSVFVDNMEKAGAIVWNGDGWSLTKEGRSYLESIVRTAQS